LDGFSVSPFSVTLTQKKEEKTTEKPKKEKRKPIFRGLDELDARFFAIKNTTSSEY